MIFRRLLQKLMPRLHEKSIESALALHRRGEARSDGLVLVKAAHHLDID